MAVKECPRSPLAVRPVGPDDDRVVYPSKTTALDLTHFPLVVVVLPARIDRSFAEVLENDHRVLFGMRSRYVSFTDTTAVAAMPDATTRQRVAEWAKSHEAELRRVQVANALLVPNAVIRAGLSAIHWFAPPPVPTAIETDPAACLSFLRHQALAAGLTDAGFDTFQRSSNASSHASGARSAR